MKSKITFSISLLFFVLFLFLPVTIFAETIAIYGVRAKKTELKRGDVFEAQLETARINENMTINLVFDGTEYFAPEGGGACRSDNGMFLGWIEDTSRPVARILCTVPFDIPQDTQKVELIAYQFRDCDDGGTRCSEVKSDQTLTLLKDEQSEESEEATPEAESEESIRERVTREKPVHEKLLESLFGGFSNGTSSETSESDDSDDSGDAGDSGDDNQNQGNPPSTVTNADCKKHSSPTLQYICQVYNDIRTHCRQYKAGQVIPENRTCLQTVSSLPPNSKANMINNAKQNYLVSGNVSFQCPNGAKNHSRGLQCMGFAQATWAALNGDTTSNPFMGKMVPQNLIGASDIAARFDVLPISSCKSRATAGKPIWFVYTFHISVGTFLSNGGDTIELYEGNYDYCGTVNTRKMGVSGSSITHCLIPKNLQ